MKLKLPERRRYIRIEVPLRVAIMSNGGSEEVYTKNISPIGMRFEIARKFDIGQVVEMLIHLPTSEAPISVKSKVIWQDLVSLEDNAPYDVGAEIVHIEESSKMLLLKYLCDLLYRSSYKLEW